MIKRSDSLEYENFYKDEGVTVNFSTPCNGTAHEKTLTILGIEKTEKAMLFSTVTGTTLKRLCKRLTDTMKIDLPDRGVAVAVPLSGIGGSRALGYLTEGQEFTKEGEEFIMESSHELIVAIYEKGYTKFVMDAARDAGAGGGTTIHAKGTGAGSEKFFGMSIAEEKEMVFIVSHTDKKKDIMSAIMNKAGIDSKAHAVVFSLPVAATAGFRFADTVSKDAE
ncbi:MAG: P-II family nitrogen regulator [Clostridia bacterium]|nr:P-II family nitrogen regulator [Clostridia bacterium]